MASSMVPAHLVGRKGMAALSLAPSWDGKMAARSQARPAQRQPGSAIHWRVHDCPMRGDWVVAHAEGRGGGRGGGGRGGGGRGGGRGGRQAARAPQDPVKQAAFSAKKTEQNLDEVSLPLLFFSRLCMHACMRPRRMHGTTPQQLTVPPSLQPR
jgi:hypothetical protein